jgi:hypothetical protein
MNKGLLYLLARAGLVDEKVVDGAVDGRVLARSTCPIHKGADNPTAFTIKGEFWHCNTHGCSGTYGSKLEGLVVALADSHANPPIRLRDKYGHPNFAASRRWLAKEAGRLKSVFADRPSLHCSDKPRNKPSSAWCSRQRALDSLHVPSVYFQTRGFAPDTLRAYAIGDPVSGGAFGHLAGWAIVPLFGSGERKESCIGYVARNVGTDHESRWKVSPGLPPNERLFNREVATRAAQWDGRLLVVEGVGDALRCVEAGFPNVIAVLGSSLSDDQRYPFLSCGVREAVVLADKDKAGDKFAAQVRQQVQGIMDAVHVISVPDPYKDIGEMPMPEAREYLRQALPLAA